MNTNPDLRAADVAKIANCHRNTVTKYSDKGIISAFRDSNGFRWFSLEDALKLREILHHREPDTLESRPDV